MSNKPTGAGTNDGDVDETVDQPEHEREPRTDDREHALDAREAQIEAREASRAERLDDSRDIRADADVPTRTCATSKQTIVTGTRANATWQPT
jgi:hypothetical protein